MLNSCILAPCGAGLSGAHLQENLSPKPLVVDDGGVRR
jgi:hypothetical protein